MGYDFLGTMGKTQWKLIKDFSETHIKMIEDSEGDHSRYTRHLIAEVLKAEKVLADLNTICDANFAGFKGDFPFIQDLLPDEPPTVRLNLADADTANNVYKLKDFQRPMLKRKKDNLEYRIKKARDLVDQLENKITLALTIRPFATKITKTVDRHFTDGLHKHNLPLVGEVTNQIGKIVHRPENTVQIDPPNLEQ